MALVTGQILIGDGLKKNGIAAAGSFPAYSSRKAMKHDD